LAQELTDRLGLFLPCLGAWGVSESLCALCCGLFDCTHGFWRAKLAAKDLLGKACTCACNGANGATDCASAKSQGGFACANKLLANAGLWFLLKCRWYLRAWDLICGIPAGLNHCLGQSSGCVHVASFIGIAQSGFKLVEGGHLLGAPVLFEQGVNVGCICLNSRSVRDGVWQT
jgi:hypothetical protein